MPTPGRHRRHFAEAVTAFAAPGVTVLVVLALVDILPVVAAAGATALLVVLAAVAAHFHVREIDALAVRAEELGIEDSGRQRRVGFMSLGADLTVALVRARRRLRRIHDALEARASGAESVIDAVPEPLLVLDSNRLVLHANLASQTLLGARLAGRDLSEILRNPAVLEGVGETLRDGYSRAVDFELKLPVERAMRARIGSLAQWGDTEGAIILTLEDMTAIRRSEQMRVDFVANVSHELRTPIASLRGFIETLLGPAREDEEARERFLGIMLGQAERMSRIVDDLLSLSRIELDEHNRPTGVVALLPTLENVADALEPVAAKRNVTIRLDAPADLPTIPGDSGQIEQVVRNLLENAIKYGREGTEVRIVVRRDEDGRGVSVATSDQGEGIERKHISRLTERFYRVDTARSRDLGGTGLGLAIVKHIVNRHRGRLGIESEVGRGSTFTITLPIENGRLPPPS